jgi:DNA modification methylase
MEKTMALEAVYIDIEDLVPLPGNPKDHDQGGIGEAVSEFGYLERMIVNRTTGHLISGHGRREDLLQRKVRGEQPPENILVRDGRWLAPADYTELPAEKEMGAALALNRLTEIGGWKEPLLFDALSGLMAQGEEMLRGTGFDPDDLDELQHMLFPEGRSGGEGESEEAIARADELQEKWQVQPGDLWTLGEHRVICGDCTDLDTVTRLVGKNRCDITLTSPPYNVAKNSNLPNKDKYLYDSDKTEEPEYLSLLCTATLQALAVSEFVFVNVQSVSGNKLALIDYLHQLKGVYADTLIWDKQSAEPAMAKNVLNSRFEYVYIFSAKGKRTIGTREFRGTLDNVLSLNSRQDKDFSGIHKATYPVQFAEFFIENFSRRGRYVFDPFLGTGTTLLACENLGRVGLGCEIAPPYVAVALQRFLDVTGISPERMESHESE